MSGRRVEYLPDGVRRRVAPAALVEAWRARTTSVPAQYALGTADHEADLTLNEVDTEPSGYVSKGVFQISDGEAVAVGAAEADLLSLDGSVRVFAALCERRLRAVLGAADLRAVPLSDAPSDVWAYLAVAHNAGTGTATTSVRKYGLDWAAFKRRNADSDWGRRISRYGDSCISGGRYWQPEFDASADNAE